VANIYTQTEFNPTQTELIQSHEVLSLTNENPGSLIKWYSQSRSGTHRQERFSNPVIKDENLLLSVDYKALTRLASITRT